LGGPAGLGGETGLLADDDEGGAGAKPPSDGALATLAGVGAGAGGSGAAAVAAIGTGGAAPLLFWFWFLLRGRDLRGPPAGVGGVGGAAAEAGGSEALLATLPGAGDGGGTGAAAAPELLGFCFGRPLDCPGRDDGRGVSGLAGAAPAGGTAAAATAAAAAAGAPELLDFCVGRPFVRGVGGLGAETIALALIAACATLNTASWPSWFACTAASPSFLRCWLRAAGAGAREIGSLGGDGEFDAGDGLSRFGGVGGASA